jgi:hypothetical protein
LENDGESLTVRDAESEMEEVVVTDCVTDLEPIDLVSELEEVSELEDVIELLSVTDWLSETLAVTVDDLL